MSEQAIIGFFRRFKQGASLCRMHFYYNLTRVFNVLESIEGRDGIYIYKNTGGRGYGWTIGIDKTGGVNGDADVYQSFAAGSQMKSIQTKSFTVGPVTFQVKQLYKFDAPDTKAVLTGDDTDWTSQNTWQKMAIRKRDSAGNAELQFASFHPMPAGDATNTAVTWDNTKGAWIKATPSSGAPSGYTETTIPILWQYDTSSHKWQYKTATVLVKDSTTAETWTDGITFAQFSD